MSDETQKDPPKPPPKLRSVPPPRRTGNEKITVEQYRAAEDWWLRNTRSVIDLARFMGVSKKTASRLVNKGLQLLKLRPLKDSAREHDQLQEQVRQAALRKQVDLEADEIARAKRANLQTTQNLRVLGTEFLVRIRAGMNSLGPAADPWPDQEAGVARRARALAPLATMFRQVSMALREAAASEFAWIKGTAPAEGEGERSTAKALEAVTAEQWETYYRTGEFPPGVTPEALKELARQGFKLPAGG